MSLQQTAKIIFQGEDNVSRVMVGIGGHLDNFQGQLSSLNSAVGDVTAPFASLAEGVLKADAALAALAVGGLTYAFKKSMDFQTASIELQKVIGDEIDLMDDATGQARALSVEYGESATDILASTANFKQAGFNVKEAMQLTKDALDLVIAGDIDAAQASEILIAALKGFREPAAEAARLVNILNAVSNEYATDVEQLGIGMAGLSPIAFQMGFSMEETAGILTPVIEIFRSGDEAAIALKTGLLALISDTAPVKAALASIGVSQRDANGELRSGKDILADVATAFLTLDQNQKLYITSELVGIQQSARMVEVFDNLGKSAQITATAMGSAGSAAGEVATRLASSEIAVKRFVTTFEGLAITVGDEFREAATGAINGGAEIIAALNSVVAGGALDPLFAALEQGLNELGVFLAEVAEALPAAFERVNFDELLQALRGLGLEIGGLFDGLDLTTPEGLAKAIQLVVDSITGLVNVTSGMVQGARPFLEMLLEMVRGFAEMDAEGQKTIGSVTGFMGALNKLTGPIGQVLDAIQGISQALYAMAGVSVVRAVAGLVGSGGLTAALGSVAAGAGSLVTVLTSPAGLLAVTAALAGTEVVRAVQAFGSWQDAEEELEGSLKRGAVATQLLADKYAEISRQTGTTITSTEEFHRLIDEGSIALNKQTGEWERVTEKQRDYLAEVRSASAGGETWNETIRKITDSQGNLLGAVDSSTEAIDENREKAIAASAAYHELRGNSPEVARAMATMEQGITKTSDAMKKATEDTDKLREKMLELASDERIRTIELAAEIKIANIEAETQRIEAAFGSITSTVDTLTESIGGLFDNLGGAGSFGEKWAIEEQLQIENDLRREAFELQKRLTEAQIESVEIQNERLRSGGALINIKADGLEPELEAFMFKIIERVQVRVNESAADFLLISP